MRLLKYVVFIQFYVISIFAADKCPYFTTSLKDLTDVTKKQCETNRDSKQCQDHYKKIASTMEAKEVDRRKLTCDKTVWTILTENATPILLRGACRSGLANFALDTVQGTVGLFKSVGTAIGEGVAYMQIETEKQSSKMQKCNSDNEEKKTLITATVSSWPKAMRPNSFPANLLTKNCWEIDNWLKEQERFGRKKLTNELSSKMYSANKTLTVDEQIAANYLDPQYNKKNPQSFAISEMAAGFMKQFNDSAACYNSEFQTELYCESLATAATFIIPGMAAFRAARLEKLAALGGRKLTDIEIDVLAQNAKRAGGIKDLALRQDVVDSIKVLGNEDRLAVAEKILGRSLTKDEAESILKAHELSSDELLAKARELQKAGFSEDEIRTFMRSSLTGKPSSQADLAKQLVQYSKLEDGPTKWRLLAGIEEKTINGDLNKVTNLYKNATESLQTNLKNKVSISPNELYTLESNAADWGSRTKIVEDSAKASKVMMEAFDKRIQNELVQAKIPESYKADYVLNALQRLKNDPGLGSAKTATNFKIKAIIDYYKTQRWNLY
ncbi:MAG: hypothetical protein WA160_11145 [Pseudobdellovibrio sp.]